MSLIDNYYRFVNCDKTESTVDYRSEFRRDYGRVLHSPSFRRLENKTQLFPGQESDFFRNRLTHSLEVAQIAESIAIRIKAIHPNIDLYPEVCELAGLIHDIGHPPFGHNGEAALDECMLSCGGFEGNAQSLRVITRLEKKEHLENEGIDAKDGDKRVGLNLTSRVIASALKYDNIIPSLRRTGSALVKGYYDSEKDIVKTVKEKVIGDYKPEKFKTIECSIMDLADDIAYSTYDIEDAFKGGFLTPYSILAADDAVYEDIIAKLRSDDTKIESDISECRGLLFSLFSEVWTKPLAAQQLVKTDDTNFNMKTLGNFMYSYVLSESFAQNGYYRTRFTSTLVNKCIEDVDIEINNDCPVLSKAFFRRDTLITVTILKYFAFRSLINSTRFKVAENRGHEIVVKIFKKLTEEKGTSYLPQDFQNIYFKMSNEVSRMRVICDFIAGMTDRYALEFYERLFSENSQTIYRPLY